MEELCNTGLASWVSVLGFEIGVGAVKIDCRDHVDGNVGLQFTGIAEFGKAL